MRNRDLVLVAIASALVGCVDGAAGGGDDEAASATIGQQGSALRMDDARLTVPAGALDAALTLSMRAAPDGSPPGNVGRAWELGPHGTTFAAPVTLSLAYDAADLASAGDAALLNVAVVEDGAWV